MQLFSRCARRAYAHLRRERSALGFLFIFVCALSALVTATTPRGATTATALRVPATHPAVAPKALPELAFDSTQVLWLARAIYSETKQPHEQELVAWAIRNRVDTQYRGGDSYRAVVLDPWQFSAFNTNNPKRQYYSSLAFDSSPPGFQQALDIAERVATAPDSSRPFPETTRHFYSERSMVGGRSPGWAANKQPVMLDRKVDPRRFRFFAGVL